MTRKEEFGQSELEDIRSGQHVRPRAIFEAIRREGMDELQRPASSLALSGLTAGLVLGLSVFSQALLRAYLPDLPWRPLVQDLGYSVGFVIVILGQMQLFTENTITAVCPVMYEPERGMWYRLARLWSLVFLCNMVGAALFAVTMVASGTMAPAVKVAFIEISVESLSHGWWDTLLRGVGAGWLVAALVWILPNAQKGAVAVIVLVTYLIALADFAHVIAGTTDVTLLMLVGQKTLWQGLNFLVPALIGNVIGGTVLFTLLTWGQISAEMPPPDRNS